MNKATVAIIGGGFCGTVGAIRLLSSRRSGGPSLPFGSRVVLVEPGRPGAGLAYRAGPDYWRLNVPAGRMSAFPERPADFLEWARARDARIASGDFLPRAWYGDYLAERLDLARRRSPRWLAFEHLATRATGLEVGGNGARIRLPDGAVLAADRVLLALGNAQASTPLPGATEIVDDPWDLSWLEDLPDYVPQVLVVGTGLSMIDMALAISDRRPDTRMLAISRHGLLPLPHVTPEPASLQSMREAMPELWRAAPLRLRRRFLRHLRAWWNVHRHRAPPETLERIVALRARKRLEVAAGRILGTRRFEGGIVVTWKPRRAEAPRDELVDAVINVSGPDANPARSSCPLVRSLLEQGLCEPDALGLGWGTDEDGRLLDAAGEASEILYYAGPLLRPRYCEATAVPVLGAHAERATA